MTTTDVALLNKKIKESGLKKNAIADKLKPTCAGYILQEAKLGSQS